MLVFRGVGEIWYVCWVPKLLLVDHVWQEHPLCTIWMYREKKIPMNALKCKGGDRPDEHQNKFQRICKILSYCNILLRWWISHSLLCFKYSLIFKHLNWFAIKKVWQKNISRKCTCSVKISPPKPYKKKVESKQVQHLCCFQEVWTSCYLQASTIL